MSRLEYRIWMVAAVISFVAWLFFSNLHGLFLGISLFVAVIQMGVLFTLSEDERYGDFYAYARVMYVVGIFLSLGGFQLFGAEAEWDINKNYIMIAALTMPILGVFAYAYCRKAKYNPY